MCVCVKGGTRDIMYSITKVRRQYVTREEERKQERKKEIIKQSSNRTNKVGRKEKKERGGRNKAEDL